MAPRSFYGYSSDALTYDAKAMTFTLHPDYDFKTGRLLFDVTVGDDFPEDDNGKAGIDRDTNQSVVVTNADGGLVASGRVFVEKHGMLQAPDGAQITVDRIEVDGIEVGYMLSVPLEPGIPCKFIRARDGDQSGGAEGCQAVMSDDGRQRDSVPGFGPGTMIRTQDGEIPVEWLETSDMVLTRDHGYQPIVWIGRTRLQPCYFAQYPEERPVCIPAGACGSDCPTHDLYVAGEHRLLFTSARAELLYFSNEVLAPAKAWVDRGRAFQITPVRPYTLTHIACAHHEVILAQGTWAETMFPGPENMCRLSEEDAARLARAIGEEGMRQATARPCLTRDEAVLLIEGTMESGRQQNRPSVLRRA